MAEIITRTCIVCPNGCELTIKVGDKIEVEGATCKRGITYGTNEVTNPMRSLTTTVRVENGELPLVSVRTDGVIPKAMLKDAVKELSKIKVSAPVERGQVICADLMGTGVAVRASKNIAVK